MAPLDLSVVRWQTDEIFKFLFEDDEKPVRFRTLKCHSDLETDGPGDGIDEFDAAALANKLKIVAEKLNNDVEFKAVLNDLTKAVAQEAVETAFTNGVEALCKNPALSVEVTSEVQLVATAVAFAQFAINSVPSLKNKVRGAVHSFLHSRTDEWVSQQGGWDKVKM